MVLCLTLFWLLSAPLAQAADESSIAQGNNQVSNLGGNDAGDFIPARAGGSRGCASGLPPNNSAAAQSSLILLVSQPGSILRTRSPRPTFTWYVRDRGAWPLELRIYRQRPQALSKEILRLRDDQHFLSQQGLMTLTLPKHKMPLEYGERYLWQVVIQCEPDEPSSYLFATAHLEVVSNRAPISLGAITSQTPPSAPALSLFQGALPLGSDHPEVLNQEKLNRWLKQRLQGQQRSPTVVPWQHLGLSEAEAQVIESSPIHSAELPSAQ